MNRFIHIVVAIILISLLETLFFKQPDFMKSINNYLIDQAFLYRGEKRGDDRIVIIDIDEKSLKELGQWPWSRDKIAKILENLTNAGIAIVGLDMVFAEPDRTSPKRLAKDLNISFENLRDNDEILAKTLQNSPVIAGFTFNFIEDLSNEPPMINAVFIERGKSAKESYLLQAKGVTPNIEVIQNSAYSSGSFNTIPGSDGVIRYVPLVISYDGMVYPTLSFEMIRVMLGSSKVEINYDQNGVESVKVGEITIPTDRNGRVFVNYSGGAKSYRYISASDIYRGDFDPSQIKDKIALFGTSAAGLLDLRSTPFDKVYPGVEVHANVIDNIINDNIISSPSFDVAITALMLPVVILLIGFVISYFSPLVSFLVTSLFIYAGLIYYFESIFDKKVLFDISYPFVASLLSIFAYSFLKIFFEYRQKELIKDKFAKKVSPAVAAELIKSRNDSFSAASKEVTIFFSDVRDFTTISERLNDPKILIDFLNSYMSPMSEIIIEHNGTIDKYIGDAIMAYWNAPLQVIDHADLALSASIKQIESLRELNKELSQKGYPSIDIGIGLHTGVAVVGEMGSEGRSDYTIIGDSVNLASRIESLCKTYGAKILLSSSTKDALKKEYKLREVDRVKVKGKDKAVTLFEVLGCGEFSESESELLELYNRARELYLKGEFKEAYKLFYRCFEIEEHKLYALYMDRCASLQKEDIKDFNGVYRFTTK
jgi:adenylate cyclase